jgi:A/G-specific adenine glycosylase
MEIVSHNSHHPGDVNQALMELGAMVCMPQRALCTLCPLRAECRGFSRLADVTVLPKKAPTRRIPHYDIGAAIIERGGKILITQRPPEGLLGGMWEFPGGKLHAGETLEECVAREIDEELGIEIAVGELFAVVKHAYSHFKITLHAYRCKPLAGRVKKIGVADFRWVKSEELTRFAFPKADKVIIEKLKGSS